MNDESTVIRMPHGHTDSIFDERILSNQRVKNTHSPTPSKKKSAMKGLKAFIGSTLFKSKKKRADDSSFIVPLDE
jgi:hypothetical protein